MAKYCQQTLVDRIINVVVTPNGRMVKQDDTISRNITAFRLEGAVYDIERGCYVGFMVVHGIPGNGRMSMGVIMSVCEPANAFFERTNKSGTGVPLEVKRSAKVMVALMNIQLRDLAGTLWIDRSTESWCREMVFSHVSGELVHYGEERVRVRYEIGQQK